MVHQYKNNGYNIVLDVNSGSVHVVDDLVYDIIALYENRSKEEIVTKLSADYKAEDIEEAYSEIEELVQAECLLPRIFIKIISLILKSGQRLSRLYVCILPMTVIWPVSTALRKRANTMDAEH